MNALEIRRFVLKNKIRQCEDERNVLSSEIQNKQDEIKISKQELVEKQVEFDILEDVRQELLKTYNEYEVSAE